ncbi:hypothetical protein Belba_0065 [Belliella baltica DSM 15883]|uniref:Uncharacterized protein n=1 Tax=Belliella baltica (strain DSM 15883 / CIP 108006 / LMG 21964 / BA134) TaxID=866536 RepID=I3Z0G9_BELBD|nr:hypothetical protein [Belliella baltica]AFL82737.1 hypothetical protein Belba_0065 [Belliella baltica DSM 15883]
MKKLIIALLSTSILFSCKQEKSIEERYIYEEDKIVDIETGDEYLLEESDQEFLIIHEDGSQETIPVDETPFFGTTLSNEYISEWKENMAAREQKLLEEKKEKLKQARRDRYAELSNEELMEKFQKSHDEGIDMSLQIDMIAELVERGAISDEDAPDLLEIEPELINFDIEIEAPDDNM